MVLALTILGSLAMAAQAGASPRIYWTNFGGNTIGRANLDGSEVNQSLITGLKTPYGIAIDAHHLYWSIDEQAIQGGGIARANLDGTAPEEGFITGAEYPEGIALADGRLYWANEGAEAIGRANVDGTEADNTFIKLENEPEGVAVSSTHVYWADPSLEAIGSANLDGSGKVERLISGLGNVTGVGVDATHIYWAEFKTGDIGRANLDGSGVDKEFITGADGPTSVVTNGSHIYWTNYRNGTIGRANLDGTQPNQTFITGGNEPAGLAIVYKSPTLAANASAAEVSVGTPVRDVATLAGSEEALGSTITFKLYGPADPTCTGTPLSTSQAAVLADGAYESGSFTPAVVGTYHWVAGFSGNEQNQPVSGNCGDARETVKVLAAPPATKVTPATAFFLKKLKRSFKSGSGKLAVKVPAAGTLKVSGKGVKTKTRQVTAGGVVKLPVVPKGSYAQVLKAHRRAYTTVKVSFTPTGGTATVKTRRIRLVQR